MACACFCASELLQFRYLTLSCWWTVWYRHPWHPKSLASEPGGFPEHHTVAEKQWCHQPCQCQVLHCSPSTALLSEGSCLARGAKPFSGGSASCLSSAPGVPDGVSRPGVLSTVLRPQVVRKVFSHWCFLGSPSCSAITVLELSLSFLRGSELRGKIII